VTLTLAAPAEPATERPCCTACDRGGALAGQLLCSGCKRRLGEHLDEIGRGYGRLNPTPGVGGDGGRGAPGFGSRSPARDEVIALTDRRRNTYTPSTSAGARPESGPNAYMSLFRLVAWWADEARDVGLLAPLGGLRSVVWECWELREVLDDLARRWWVADMARDIEHGVLQLRRALHELESTIPVGRCPLPAPGEEPAYLEAVAELGEILAAQSAAVPRCDGELRARAWGEEARCRRCGTRWNGGEALRRLGAQLGEALLDLPGLVRYLGGVKVATLRKWAQRDGWGRVKIGGRTLYRLADARESAWKAWCRRASMDPASVAPVIEQRSRTQA
jgi:hypothetical protein